MNTLAFDCSTSGCSAAIIDGTGQVLAQAALLSPVAQAQALIPLLQTVLENSGLGWNDLGLIGVTVGPGSFTGLRIGLAAARGLGLARRLSVVGISTAEIFAHAVSIDERKDRTILVAIESKRADLFVQLFSADLVACSPLETALPEVAMALTTGPLVLAGDGAHRLPITGGRAVLAGNRGAPDAVIVARRAALHFAAGDGLAATPLYLRPPDVTVSASSASPLP